MIELSYNGSREPRELAGQGAFEQSIEVRYEFDRLLENRYLSNSLVEATDSRIDRYVTINDYCVTIDRIGQSLATLNQ